jgi:hypothetical protein
MLFIPKIDYIEKRMLLTNIARMILSRAQPYLKEANFHLQENIIPGELDAEFELAYDIANDPNALEYFENDTPMDNMIKRFKCQVELYKTVINLRQGRYYSTGYDQDDGITGLIRILNSFNWTYFDSPELFHVQDEGTILRKLLSVFSCRPTFTQLSSYSERYGIGYTSVSNLAKTVFVNIPIVNIKLPMESADGQVHAISLTKALTQNDYFLEHRAVVPKNKSVIYSNQVAFFYANRKYPTSTFNSLSVSMRCIALPISVINQTTINKTRVLFDSKMRIGRDWFNLRSVVLLQRPPVNGLDIALGSSAVIVADSSTPANAIHGGSTVYLHYNPSVASIQYYDASIPQGQSQYISNTPFTWIEEYNPDPNNISFRTESQERGTIFFYVKI